MLKQQYTPGILLTGRLMCAVGLLGLFWGTPKDARAQENSLTPGINDKFLKEDIGIWVRQFESEAARSSSIARRLYRNST